MYKLMGHSVGFLFIVSIEGQISEHLILQLWLNLLEILNSGAFLLIFRTVV